MSDVSAEDVDRAISEAFAAAFKRVFREMRDEVGRADAEVVGRGVASDGCEDARCSAVRGAAEEAAAD